MKEKNTRTKKMTQKIMIFLAVMICVGMISAVTTTAVTNDKTPTTTNQAESKSNVTKTTVNKKNTDLNNKETVNKNNTDSNNKTIKANSKKKKTPVAKFKTKKGKTYCKISGKKIKNQLVTVKNKTYLFDKKGVMVIDKANCNQSEDDLMMIALDAGADDFNEEEDSYEITTAPDDFGTVSDALSNEGITFASAEVTMIPQTMVELTSEDDIKKMRRILALLDEEDDVQNVYHNWDEPIEDEE